jgi:hypothetical protein
MEVQVIQFSVLWLENEAFKAEHVSHSAIHKAMNWFTKQQKFQGRTADNCFFLKTTMFINDMSLATDYKGTTYLPFITVDSLDFK